MMSKHYSDQKTSNLENSDMKEEALGLFVCGVCSTSFPNKRKLTFHLKKKHNQPCKIPDCELICYVCCKKFSQPYNLQRHISRVHKKDKPFSCDRCGKTFSDKRTMLHHREYQHSEHRCSLCGLSFDKYKDSETHQCCAIYIEGSEKPYGCKICKRWFGNGSTLHLHVKTHSFIEHVEDNCKLKAHYTCGVCTEVFKTRKEFNDHMKSHKKDQLSERKTTADILYHEPKKIVVKKIDLKNGKVLVECDICGKSLSMNSIQKHRKIHNGEVNMPSCSLCGKVLSSSHNLKRHMNSVHMSEKSFCCEYCGKLFAEKATMLYHKYTQHARNACKKCGLSFESKSRLHKHKCLAVLYDNGSKKPLYGCKKCKKCFIHRCKLHRHMLKNHFESGSKIISAKTKRLIEKFKHEGTEGNMEMEDREDNSDERGSSHYSSDNNVSDQDVCSAREDLDDDRKIHHKNLNVESGIGPSLTLFHEPEKTLIKKVDSENGLVLVECDICQKMLSINSLQNHKKLHSGRQNNYKCSVCEKVLSNLHNLRRHMNTVHMNEKSFCCEYCGKLFTEKNSMTYHVNSQHAKIVCKSCGLSFETKFSLQKHECLAVLYDIGEKENRFGCKKCGKGFNQRYKLHRHIWKHVRPKIISAKSKRLIEKFRNEAMEDVASSSDERGISSDSDVNVCEMDDGESEDRSLKTSSVGEMDDGESEGRSLKARIDDGESEDRSLKTRIVFEMDDGESKDRSLKIKIDNVESKDRSLKTRMDDGESEDRSLKTRIEDGESEARSHKTRMDDGESEDRSLKTGSVCEMEDVESEDRSLKTRSICEMDDVESEARSLITRSVCEMDDVESEARSLITRSVCEMDFVDSEARSLKTRSVCETDVGESEDRSFEAKRTLSIVSYGITQNENIDKRAAGVLFCEICKEMFLCKDDFEHHQMWHEEVSLDTE